MADCEASIEETESAIAIVEAKMATPEGASDIAHERHQKLKQQLDGIVEEWERVRMELEETKTRTKRILPSTYERNAYTR